MRKRPLNKNIVSFEILIYLLCRPNKFTPLWTICYLLGHTLLFVVIVLFFFLLNLWKYSKSIYAQTRITTRYMGLSLLVGSTGLWVQTSFKKSSQYKLYFTFIFEQIMLLSHLSPTDGNSKYKYKYYET